MTLGQLFLTAGIVALLLLALVMLLHERRALRRERRQFQRIQAALADAPFALRPEPRPDDCGESWKPGWYCTRTSGHDGPHALEPS